MKRSVPPGSIPHGYIPPGSAQIGRNPLRMLTRRGHGFWVLGLFILGAGMLADQRDVLRIGLLLIAVPVLALFLVTGARLRLSCRREISPERVQIGASLIGRIQISRGSRLPAGMVLLEDCVPPELGNSPRFTLDHSSASRTRSVEYPLFGRVRGRWTCGPVLVRTTDPFGLVRVDRRFTATTEVLVTPQISRLRSLNRAGGQGRAGETPAHQVGIGGADDVLIREYRDGDDVRRVHWPSTARRGELMVRREEQSSDPGARIILDSRTVAHAGTGIDDSLEWAVSAATSIGLHFLVNGYALEVFDAGGRMPLSSPGQERQGTSTEMLIRRFSELRGRRTTSMRYALDAARPDRRIRLAIAIMGRTSAEEANTVLRAQPAGTGGLAIMLDVDSFADSQHRTEPPASPSASSWNHQQLGRAAVGGPVDPSPNDPLDGTKPPGRTAADVLRANGWQVIVAQHQTSVAEIWDQFLLQAAR